MISKAGRAWWAFLATLLLLVIWLASAGNVVLNGFPIEVLEGLARGKSLLLHTAGPSVDGAATIGSLPGDGFWWAGSLTLIANVLAALVLYLGGRRVWKNPVAPTLAVGALFLGGQALWLQSPHPGQSLVHLLVAGALVTILHEAVPVLAGLVMAIAVGNPAYAIMLSPALVWLSYRRRSAYGPMMPALTLAAVGCAFLPLTGSFHPLPGLGGMTLWSLVPLGLCLISSPIRKERAALYAALLLGSAFAGAPEMATALALGDIVSVAFRLLSERPRTLETEDGGERTWRVPGPAVLGALATAVLIAVILPGERSLNRRILIPAQKAHVPLSSLLGVFSLRDHARKAASEPWRTLAPFPEMSKSDFGLALSLSGGGAEGRGFGVLTLDTALESRRVALLYALISGRQLRGWDGPEHLAAPLLLCKARGKNFLANGPELVFRTSGKARVAEPPTPLAKGRTPARLDFRSVLLLPYRIQEVSRSNGASYRWFSDGEAYELVFSDQRAEMMLSSRPGEYRISSLAPRGAVRHFEVQSVKWALTVKDEDAARILPSRSLVPLKLRLVNKGLGPISSDLVSSWSLEPTSDASFSPFTQEASKPFILYPGETVEVALQLATPEPEGVFSIEARAVTPEGELIAVPLEGISEVRTWRRLPPVGTWVEEP